MQIKETPHVAFPRVESPPLEDVIVLADSAGVALGVQRTFGARVRSVRHDGSGLIASRFVEIPLVGRGGEISGVLCRTAPRSDTRGVFSSRRPEEAGAIGDVAQFVVHDVNNLPAVIGSGLRLLERPSDAAYRKASQQDAARDHASSVAQPSVPRRCTATRRDSAMELIIPPGRLDRPVDHETDHVLGPTDAEITLVEYSSYACPHCRAADEPIAQARDQLGDRVCYAFRHRPLTDNSLAFRAAEFAKLAQTPEAFWSAQAGGVHVAAVGRGRSPRWHRFHDVALHHRAGVSKSHRLLSRQDRRVRRVDSFGRRWDCPALGSFAPGAYRKGAAERRHASIITGRRYAGS